MATIILFFSKQKKIFNLHVKKKNKKKKQKNNKINLNYFYNKKI